MVDSGKFKGMLIGYNALNYRFRQSGIEAAYNKGMGVVVMNPLRWNDSRQLRTPSAI
ncbi:MAG: hypothetical protein ACLTT1_13405 [[Clostridium] scindens]